MPDTGGKLLRLRSADERANKARGETTPRRLKRKAREKRRSRVGGFKRDGRERGEMADEVFRARARKRETDNQGSRIFHGRSDDAAQRIS